jgi:hypothetical protein
MNEKINELINELINESILQEIFFSIPDTCSRPVFGEPVCCKAISFFSLSE